MCITPALAGERMHTQYGPGWGRMFNGSGLAAALKKKCYTTYERFRVGRVVGLSVTLVVIHIQAAGALDGE